ncbi:MAG TPA: hypothetical protein VEH00_05605 [Steroidobacteraceae bacterium]|nr:hypothetical protein [Steroidobacteraceae bacterium]
MALLGAALLAIAGCSHVADALTNTGAALRRHSGQSEGASQGAAAQNSGGATKAQFDAISAAYKAWREECKASMKTPELDPIRHKVELYREPGDEPLPFEIATNDSFPTSEDRPVIAKWASLLDECIRRYEEVPTAPEGANQTQLAIMKTVRSFAEQAFGDVTELIICLYQQKLTYVEFGRKYQEMGKAMGAFNLAITQASAGGGNTQHQLEDLQTAQQQFTDTLEAFGKYVHTVSARKPKTVRVSAAGG